MSKEHKTLFKAFKALSHYKTLAEQGRLLELPAAIGTTVWFIENNFVIDYKVARIIINESGIDCIQVVKEINGHEFWNGYSLEEFNKRFFLAKSEAEQALKQKAGKPNG